MAQPRRRLSRGTPYVIAPRDQEILTKLVDNDDELREDIQTLLDVNWSDLTKPEKVKALLDYQESGFVAALLANVAGARRNLRAEADFQRGLDGLADRVKLLEEELKEARRTIADNNLNPPTNGRRRALKEK